MNDNILEGADLIDEERKTPAYKSQDGFIGVPVLRGFTEISGLYNLTQDIGGSIICGGYVRWMCSIADNPIPAGDVDVYFDNEGSFDHVRKVLEGKGFMVKHSNEISTTFFRNKNSIPFAGCPEIQLIRPINEGRMVLKGDMESILSNFDFTVVRAGLTSNDAAMVDADFPHDESSKILRLKNIHCPVGSTLRCMKYSKKGYWLPPTQALKLFMDWDSRDIKWKDRLIEFLETANDGEGLTQKEIDEMERMMRID